MTALLLDVNVLVALAWPQHVHHGAAQDWFAQLGDERWSTSPVTEAGFVRVSSNARVISDARTPAEAAAFITALRGFGRWEFWADAVEVSQCLNSVVGYRQVTDAHLLQLAHDHAGAVATFDAGLVRLAETRGQSALLIGTVL